MKNSTHKMTLIVGEPATGKSTIVRKLMENYTQLKSFKFGLVRGKCDGSTYFIGVFDGSTFEGTDKLSMAVQADFDKFMQHLKDHNPKSMVVLEGDRLSTAKTIENNCPSIIVIESTDEVKYTRHKNRNDSQTPKFLKAKRTKIENIKSKYKDLCVCFNNNEPDSIEEIVCYISKLIK